MVDAQKKAAAAQTDKVKRVVLSPSEKIAKLEAELAVVKSKAHDKDRKVVTTLQEKRGKLVSKQTALNAEIAAIDKLVAEATERVNAAVLQENADS